MARRALILAALLVLVFAACGISPLQTWPEAEAGEDWQQVILRPETGKLAEALQETVSLGLKSLRDLPHDLLLMKVPPYIDLDLLSHLPSIAWAEPDITFRAAGASAVPNDPDYSSQWNLQKIDMPAAWDIAKGGKSSVTVAVVDSGVAYRTAGKYTRAPDFQNTVFGDGYDFINNDDFPDDDYGHGTHMAAIIASSHNNSFRAAGMAYSCTIMPVRVLGLDGVGTASSVSSGIYYAVDNGADIICLSLASPRHSEAVAEAVDYAYQQGVLCVAAAGNEGSDPGYPGGMDCPADGGISVLAVGATDYRDARAHYSNYGDGLDLVAPGGDLTRDDNGDGYGDGVPQESFREANNCQSGFELKWGEGTSMSTPQVAAAAALMLSMNPKLTPAEITSLLTSSCDDLGTQGWDEYYGFGRLNVGAAMEKILGSSWYFAEGTTRSGFDEWLCVLNPEDEDAYVDFSFFMQDGSTQSASCTIPARSRFSLNVRDQVGEDKDVAAYISSPQDVFAERAMYFSYQGRWDGGSVSKGAASLTSNWYFAEGTTRSGFDEWLTLANPGDSDALVKVEYMLGAGQGDNVLQEWNVPAHSRVTVSVNQAVGEDVDVSMRVTSDYPIVAERPMYFSYQGTINGGHDVMGATSTGSNWYFAEGTTRSGFDEWLTLANPGDSDALVKVEYMLGAGQGDNVLQEWNVPAHSRVTVSVNQAVGEDVDVSMRVTSDYPIVAERPMYFSYQGTINGGHDVMGATSTGSNWYFAEGTTRSGFDEWLTLANPGDSDALVKVEYMLGAGQGDNVTESLTVPAHTRVTVSVNQAVGEDVDVSMRVTSDYPIVAERPMYFVYGSQQWRGGTCETGFDPVNGGS
ncbi:MAG: DUF5719 family protein [Actinomycetota bacterium]|nr:DUF5719 family protein [Actinomycetota bacterium]